MFKQFKSQASVQGRSTLETFGAACKINHGKPELQHAYRPTVGQRCLIIVSPRIGDVIFCTPAIHILRKNIASASLKAIAMSPAAALVLENNPDITELFVLPAGRALENLSEDIDFVIDFHNNRDTTRLRARIKRPSFASPRSLNGKHQSLVATEFICRLFSDDPDHYEQSYRLFNDHGHIVRARKCLADAGATLDQDEILIGCHMGTYSYAKRASLFFRRTRPSEKAWSPAFFSELIETLLAHDRRIRFVLTGTASESRLVKPLKEKWPDRVIDISGRTTVLELKSCMQYLTAFVCPDTGPLHVASSTSVPIIYLSSDATNAIATGPYPRRDWHHTLHAETMDGIQPKQVVSCIQALIDAQTRAN